MPSNWCRVAVGVGCVAIGASVLLRAQSAAGVLTLTFERLKDGEAIQNYYAGGFGNLSSGPGPQFGVVISNAVVRQGQGLIQVDDATQTTSLSGAAAATGMVIIDVANGFETGFSVFCSNPGASTDIRVFSETGLRGRTLTLRIFSPTVEVGEASKFVEFGVAFEGVAKSVGIVSRGPGEFALDNVTLGSVRPYSSPEVRRGIFKRRASVYLQR